MTDRPRAGADRGVRPGARAARLPPSPRLPDFSKTLPLALMRAREHVMRQFRPTLREFDLSEQQWRVLRTLDHFGPLSAAALAEAAILRSPSLSRILRDLDVRGLIERRPVKTDLRLSVNRITRKGVAMIRTVAPRFERSNAEISRLVGPERLNLLRRMLHELESSLRADSPGRTGGQTFEP